MSSLIDQIRQRSPLSRTSITTSMNPQPTASPMIKTQPFQTVKTTPTPTPKPVDINKALQSGGLTVSKPQAKPGFIQNAINSVGNIIKSTASDLGNVFTTPFRDISSYIKVSMDPKASRERQAIRDNKNLTLEQKATILNKQAEKFGGNTQQQSASAQRGAEFGMLSTNPVGGTGFINDAMPFAKQIAKNVITKFLPSKTASTVAENAVNSQPTKNVVTDVVKGIQGEKPVVDKFKINIGKNDKTTVGDIRTEISGVRNKQIVTGTNFAKQLEKTITPVENKAIKWYNEAKGNVATLQTWLSDKSPQLDPYRKEITDAINLSDKGKQVAGQIQQYYTQAGQSGKRLGIINDVIDNYNNRIYKPEPPKNFISTDAMGGLKTSSRHALQRTYNTIYDAVKGGKQLADTTATDNMALHNEEMAHVGATRQMTSTMKKSGIGGYYNSNTAPEGWKPVGNLQNKVPFVDKAGEAHIASQQFYAPEGIAKGLASIVEPNFAKRIGTIRALSRYQGLVKTVDLSYSLFHHLTLTAQMLYQGNIRAVTHLPEIIKSLDSPALDAVEQDFVRHSGITSRINFSQDIMRNLSKGDDLVAKAVRLPGAKQFLAVAEKNAEFLFGKMQRYLKVTDYQGKVTGWISKHPEATDRMLIDAKRGFAKEINAAYGGLNWEQMGVSKAQQTILRLVLLAPDWTISNFALGKYALQGGTAGMAARSHLATAAFGSLAATEALNKTLTGHFTNENKPGHQFEVEISPNVYVSLFRGGIGDMLKLGSNITDESIKTGSIITGIPKGTARFATGKESPFFRTGTIGLTGQDYSGRSIYSGKTPWDSINNMLGSLGSAVLPIPIGVSSTIKYATDPKNNPNLLGAIAVGTGIGRYSAPYKARGKTSLRSRLNALRK